MHSNNNTLDKRLSPQAAKLITTLYGRHRPVFTLTEASEIVGSVEAARQIVFKLVQRGILTRLKPGLFQLVPFELGSEREYLGNPYVIARELAQFHRKKARARIKENYYLSHGSAMEIHQMTTQPLFIVYVTTPRLMRPAKILGTEFRFVRCKPSDLFGITDKWVEKTEKVQVSDLEKTIIDGLRQPKYCGGLSEVAKGLWIKRDEIEPKKLVAYALKLKIGTVIRRLGYLVELFEINASKEIDLLRKQLTASYQLLDPELKPSGKFLARWRLRLNVPKEELLAIGKT